MLLFNRYEYNPKTDLIGKGGFSRVYKALDKKFNRNIALKIYKTNEISERYSLNAEIQRVIELDHPNISRYIDIEEIEKEDSFGQVEKIQVCVMELLEGGNLAMYYNIHKDLNVFKKLLIDVLHGLSYLHAKGIIHRDIKPANILIKQNPDGPVAKITDFGISKKSDASADSSSSALIVSIPYMAPEQLNAQKYGIDEKVHFNIDLWSLGVAVYEIISGDILFKNNEQDSSEQIMTNIVVQELPQKINNLPEPFKQFVSKCLVKDAKERVKNEDELIEILQPLSTEKINKTSADKQPVKKIKKSEPPVVTPIKSPEPINRTVDENEGISNDDTAILPKVIKESYEKNNSEKTAANETDDETKVIKKPTFEDAETVLDKKENQQEHLKESSTIHSTGETVFLDKTQNEKEQSKITLFNRYTYYPLTDLIGKGGFSRVYKAMDQKLSRWVALKIYKTSEFSDRYSPIAEIKRVVNLDHSNICRYLDIEEIEKINPFGEIEKIQVCVMELLDSGNFLEYFNNCGKDMDVLKKLLQDVLNGISYLHKNGIIHRDIKPANILIKKTIEGPVAKITDFGISKVSDSVNNNSSSSLIVSIPYMAPEQLNIKKYGIDEKISYNLDLWSLGVTIYEVITGKVLFKNSEQDSSEQIMTNIMAPELPEKIKELPQPFRNIVSHCIVKNANERAQKAEELMVLLNSAKSESPALVEEVAPITEISILAKPNEETEKTESVTAIPEKPVQPIPKSKFSISESPTKAEIKKAEKVIPVPEKVDEPVLKRKFSIAEPSPQIEERAKKQISLLKILIAAAAVILIIASVFYFNISTEKKNSGNANIIDSSNKTNTVSEIKPDTSAAKNQPILTVDSNQKKNISDEDKKLVDVPKQTEIVKSEKKKDIQPGKKQQEIITTKIISSDKVTVNFNSRKPCTIKMNGDFFAELNGKKEQHNLYEGNYNFMVIYKDGQQSIKPVNISKKRVGPNGIQTVNF